MFHPFRAIILRIEAGVGADGFGRIHPGELGEMR
jgi:hypothetical protein